MCDNTVYNNRYGIRIAGVYPAVPNEVLNVEVKNNIVFGSTVQAFVAKLGGENDGTNGSGNVYTHNCFGPESTNFIEWGIGIHKSTYTRWETAYGGTTHSVQADPLFVSTSTPYFRLKLGSPAINTGVDVGLTQDYAGNHVPVGSAPDIGAYEYNSGFLTLQSPKGLRVVP